MFTGAALVFAIAITFGFDYGTSGLQFQLDVPWIPAIDARYHVGIDGISLPLFELTFVLSFLCAIYYVARRPEPGQDEGVHRADAAARDRDGRHVHRVRPDPVLRVLGAGPGPDVLPDRDLGQRATASTRPIKFFLYTLFGVGVHAAGVHRDVLQLGHRRGVHTFDIIALQDYAASGGFSHAFQLLVFAAVGLGFAVKVPMWPFHTWLPDAHTEAPTIGSVLLAGVMLKMGGYGFIRIALPILPYGAQKYAPWIGLLAAIAIVYAALACLAQKDLKRLIAFSSVGHMGFVMLGIATLTSIGINAAIFGMVAHGLITGMLFFCVGSLYDRYHTREIAEIGGGVMQKLPYLGGVFAFVAIASLGLPGLAGFWGEVMALLSSYSPAQPLSTPLFRTFMVAGGIGTILTAGYFLWMLQRVNMGTLPEKWKTESLRGRRDDRVGLLGAAARRDRRARALPAACSPASRSDAGRFPARLVRSVEGEGRRGDEPGDRLPRRSSRS